MVLLLSSVITTSSLTTLLHGQKRHVPNFIIAPGNFLKIVRSFFSNVAGYLQCFMALAIYAGILRQVTEFWNEFVLFLNADQIIVNKRIYKCALDTSLIEFSILHYRISSGILNSALKYATNTCDLFLALAIDEDTYTILIYLYLHLCSQIEKLDQIDKQTNLFILNNLSLFWLSFFFIKHIT